MWGSFTVKWIKRPNCCMLLFCWTFSICIDKSLNEKDLSVLDLNSNIMIGLEILRMEWKNDFVSKQPSFYIKPLETTIIGDYFCWACQNSFLFKFKNLCNDSIKQSTETAKTILSLSFSMKNNFRIFCKTSNYTSITA